MCRGDVTWDEQERKDALRCNLHVGYLEPSAVVGAHRRRQVSFFLSFFLAGIGARQGEQMG